VPLANPLLKPPSIAALDSSLQSLRMDRLFPLKCQVKTYAWGKLGTDSLVGRLAAEGLEETCIEPNTPYAELWMGTHPSGPSLVMLTSPWRTVTPLSEWIKLNPSLLGPRQLSGSPKLERRRSMLRMRAHSLPFLFKILSVRTALSIQAHPDKALAAELHVRHPDQYKDDNHKPEMAVAITPFEALCSFQSVHSIIANCRATPELVSLVGERLVSALDDAAAQRALVMNAELSPHTRQVGGTEGARLVAAAAPLERLNRLSREQSHDDSALEEASAELKRCFRALFEALMTAPADRVAAQLTALVHRVHSTSEMLRAPVDVLAMRLHEQYPGDVGVFCVYLLNYRTLAPGEALFLGANEPHAYISGDCAEVMATSDNVVRAGLTPKWKDVDTLVSCLTYSDGAPHVVMPTQPDGQSHVWTYTPPDVVDEFILDRVEFAQGHDHAAEATLPASSGLAILIVVRGTAAIEQLDEQTEGALGLQSSVGAGAIHLICPHTVLRVRAPAGPLLMFRASSKMRRIESDGHTGLTSDA